ncbi:MAG: diacylglycerol kinase [Roseivirga sp.]|jgi:diacylglycerol kinase
MAKPFSFKERINSFRFATNGLKQLLIVEHNFRIHLFAAIAVIFLGFYFDVTKNEWLWLVFSIGFVMVTEIINTGIERLVDLISPQINPKAGLAKDIGAAAALLASLTSAIIGLIIFYPYLF